MLAGDEAGVVAAQKRDRPGHVLRLDPRHGQQMAGGEQTRDVVGARIVQIGAQAGEGRRIVGHRGGDRPRVHGVDPDPAGPELIGEGAGEPVTACLAAVYWPDPGTALIPAVELVITTAPPAPAMCGWAAAMVCHAPVRFTSRPRCQVCSSIVHAGPGFSLSPALATTASMAPSSAAPAAITASRRGRSRTSTPAATAARPVSRTDSAVRSAEPESRSSAR